MSYTWGTRRHTLFCTLANLGELKHEIAITGLPATLRDAVSLARSLHLRYLWVGALCIIYDSPEDWKYEVMRMEDIFHEAYCVIAASSADAMDTGFMKPRQESKVEPFVHLRL